jgi:hypothetical protein
MSTLSTTPILAWRVWSTDGRFLISSTVTQVWVPGEAAHATPRGEAPGIYGYRSPQLLANSRYAEHSSAVFGTVALWGTVEEHQEGYRGEWGYPSALSCPIMARAYGCEVLTAALPAREAMTDHSTEAYRARHALEVAAHRFHTSRTPGCTMCDERVYRAENRAKREVAAKTRAAALAGAATSWSAFFRTQTMGRVTAGMTYLAARRATIDEVYAMRLAIPSDPMHTWGHPRSCIATSHDLALQPLLLDR